MKPIRYGSVCSGVEAASLAWMPLGWEAMWFSEIDPFSCAVLKERFPKVPNIGDMTKIEGEKYLGTVDLLVGGTPCQGFSVGGNLPLVHECYPINGMVIGNGVRVNDQHPTGIGTDGDPIPTITKAHHHAVAMRHTVRRLLPIETERLMGFPDNHTRIPWRGKPEEQCPDGPRYKACGNSMCVNVMRWIGMRIEHVEQQLTVWK